MKYTENNKEGDLYKVITIDSHVFELRFGYYEDFEKRNGEPIPIYPDFIKTPEYSENGSPFVTAMQDSCNEAKLKTNGFGFCNDCEHYECGEDFIGICVCREKRKNE